MLKNKKVRIFKKLIAMHFQIFLNYKWGFLITLFIVPIYMLVDFLVFKAIYSHNGNNIILGYNLKQMVWYFICVRFTYQLIWNFTDQSLSNKIISGDLLIDLLKPVSVSTIELTHAISLRLAGVLFEFIPGLILYSLIYFPDFLTPLSLLRFLSVILFSFLLYFKLNYLVGTLAFYTKNNSSFIAIKNIIFGFCGGALIPLDFLPQVAQKVLHYLPFEYIFYWPIQFFLNRELVNLDLWLKTIFIQFLWVIILSIASRLSYNSALKHFCAVG